MNSFNRSNPSDKAHVPLLLGHEAVLSKINPMVDCAYPRHGFLASLKVANRDIIDVGKVPIELAQRGVVWAMQRQNCWMAYETGHYDCLCRLNVQNLTIPESVLHAPRLVVQLFNPGML